MNLKLEIWKSSENQEEHHYFLMNEPSGAEPHTYAFGVNPKLFDGDKIAVIAGMIAALNARPRIG